MDEVTKRAEGSPNTGSSKVQKNTVLENINTHNIYFTITHIIPVKNGINKKEITTTVTSTREWNNFQGVKAFQMRETKIGIRVKGSQTINNFK